MAEAIGASGGGVPDHLLEDGPSRLGKGLGQRSRSEPELVTRLGIVSEVCDAGSDPPPFRRGAPARHDP
jgi:hypothetical protein